MNWVSRLANAVSSHPSRRGSRSDEALGCCSQRRPPASSFTARGGVASAWAMSGENDNVLEFGRSVLHDEARALDALADSLGEAFEHAVRLILDCGGKLIVR